MDSEYKVKIFLSLVYKVLSITYSQVQKKLKSIPDPKKILNEINNQMVFFAMKKSPDRKSVLKIIENLTLYAAAMGWTEDGGKQNELE